MSKSYVILALSVLILGCVACGGDETKDDQAALDAKLANAPARARNNKLSREGLSVKPSDLNRDDRPDQYTLTGEGGKVLRVERDMNFDGRLDVWEYPDETGTVREAEMDIDFDGKVDVVVFYRADASIERKELALNFTDKFTVFKFYGAAGELLRIEYDEDGDTKVDRWDYYENKRLVRTGWDENADGVPDKFDKI